MLYELLGYSLGFFHFILILLLWTTPFYLRNPTYIIWAIIIQIAVLIQLYLLNNQCILTIIEKKLLKDKMPSYKNKPITPFNKYLKDIVGVNEMVYINIYSPLFVILGNCINLYRFL